MTINKQNLSILRVIHRTVPMIFNAVPIWSSVYMVTALFNGIAVGLSAPAKRLLYDALSSLAFGDSMLRSVYISAILVTGLMMFQQIARALHDFISHHVIYPVVDIKLRQIFHSKIKTLPAKIFEDKNRLDDLEKSDVGMMGVVFIYQILINLVFLFGTYFVIMGIFLFNIQPILISAIFFTFVPVILAQVVEAKLHAKLEDESAPVRRQNKHYEECLVDISYTKETRLFGTYNFFKTLFMSTLELLTKKEWNNQKKIQVMYLGLNTIKVAGWVGILTLLFRGLIMGNITVGAFAAVFGSISMLFHMAEELLRRIKQNVTEWLGKAHNFVNVLDIPSTEGNNTPPNLKDQGIIATNVTFSYPLSEKNAVDDVTISLRPGETLALVGENGSGKSTLVKLLCGLYVPDKGKIIIGGQDSACTENSALFSKSSGVFQKFMKYSGLTLNDNVIISDCKSVKSPVDSMINADLDIHDTLTFPEGLETILDRRFHGIDLSIGQWQRLATARGLYRPHDFIVLDEPTAAIDPVEETRIYKRFMALTKDKIAILVTHRLGSARIADRIAVMDGGKIVETGTHESLLANHGKYAEMWEAQSKNYVNEIPVT